MEGRNKRYIELKTKTERRRQVTNRIRWTGLFLFSVYFYIRLTNGSIKQKSKTKIKDKRIDVIIIRSKTENTTKPKGLRYIVHGPRSTARDFVSVARPSDPHMGSTNQSNELFSTLVRHQSLIMWRHRVLRKRRFAIIVCCNGTQG